MDSTATLPPRRAALPAPSALDRAAAQFVQPWHANRCGFMTCQPEPEGWHDSYAVLDFTDQQVRRLAAVHEAGHTALMLRCGVPVIAVDVFDEDQRNPDTGSMLRAAVHIGPFSGITVGRWYACLAAGERACDRWLREQDLWTPRRAWAVEKLAAEDRDQLATSLRQQFGAELTFGRSALWTDYTEVCDDADFALHALWPQVLRLADALDACGHLTGARARQITGVTALSSGR